MVSLEALKENLRDILIQNNGDVKLSEYRDIINDAKELGIEERQLSKLLQEVDSSINWDFVRKKKYEATSKDLQLKKEIEEKKKQEKNATETLEFIIEQCSRDKIFDSGEIKTFFEISDELNYDERKSAKLLKDYLDKNNYIPLVTPKGTSLRLLIQSTNWHKDKLPPSDQVIPNKVTPKSNNTTHIRFRNLGLISLVLLIIYFLVPQIIGYIKINTLKESQGPIQNNGYQNSTIDSSHITSNRMQNETIPPASVDSMAMQANIGTTLNENKEGYYSVNADAVRKVYFHSTPESKTIRNAYFETQEDVYVQKVENGYGYVEFTNKQGQSSFGWLDMNVLHFKSLESQNNNNTIEYNIGYYTVNADAIRKVYFHSTPEFSTVRKAYFDTQEDVYIQKIENGYGYVEFTNTQGQSSFGWLDMKMLISKQ